MRFFFQKERLLLTLIVIFGVFFGIFGTIMKHTLYQNQNPDTPGIAFAFQAIHDGFLTDAAEPEIPPIQET